MPQDSLYGKPPRDFQKVDAQKTRQFSRIAHFEKWHGFMNWPFREMARAAGLEPTTCGFGDRRSTN
ncbi:conserved hypothetical protein [Mesorhizobium prunaredense]|uniref:Uncharacterized protein n=1 Tax=Mesorhizobium prunaredense TaxID=1631249 RepID=A0A1R3VDE6_9HYPH|nr:conserved hypothetical protein [Mesorhizobium prunaredense]